MLICLTATGTTQAECGCIWGGSFSRVQAGTDLVAAVTVLRESGNSIDVRVSRVLRGELFTEEIRIWLDTGDLCRAPVGSFELESSWVMALDRIEEKIAGGFNPNTPNISYGRVGDFSLHVAADIGWGSGKTW